MYSVLPHYIQVGKKTLPQNYTDLVFHCNRIPRHVNALDWAKRGKGLSDGVLTQLVVDGAHVNSTHDSQSSLTLSCYLNTNRRSQVKQETRNTTTRATAWLKETNNAQLLLVSHVDRFDLLMLAYYLEAL